MAQDYNSTLNLPKTDFQMRASLPEREPGFLADWYKEDLYNKVVENNKDKPLYVLHDGPPYANGNIHLGTAMNKVLKDIIIRYKNLSGFCAPYIPGWDTHGLPIEQKALKKLGANKNDLSKLEIRKCCQEFALSFVDIMTEQFKRLGVLGDWENPYITLRPEFEAIQIKIFGEMAKKGYIYKGLKSVYWCPHCETALAEAEIEYADDACKSVYVRFNVCEDEKGVFEKLGIPKEKAYFVIWTTTTWTLPANVAICVHPDYDYAVTKVGDKYYVTAEALVDDVMAQAGITEYEKVATVQGSELERIRVQHPFLERKSLVINDGYVTLDTGTGCVHIAPGHGVEDFEICTTKYPELPIVVPVDGKGVLTEEAGRFAGITTSQANKDIFEYLVGTGDLLASKDITHQYPHCWRCKEPILFRATEQWFCSVDGFKDDTIKAIGDVKWTPAWAKDRITGMVRDRYDWCISRQRTWGVPIPAFYCTKCGEYHITDESIAAVSELFRKEGSDGWYTHDAMDILPKGTVCKHCGGTEFTKDNDIMDVWFDSGSTHMAVLQQRKEGKWPCDLYLEGSDQYRGWFQSSLLTSVACTGKAPYKEVLSHGWVVDGEGKKMSKSLGNGIEPHEIVDQYGADILRLWVASSDYQVDVRISKDIMKQLSEAYRKIRNTARFILGNLGDFDPDTESVPLNELEELDLWALNRLNEVVAQADNYYNTYEFHGVYHTLHNFCVVDMSNFYLDVLKDRLYVEKADSKTRKAAQTTIYLILTAVARMLAPIIPFTMEEVWQFVPKSKEFNYDSIMLNSFPKKLDISFDETHIEKWKKLHAIRDDVKKALEAARTEKLIGASLEANAVVYTKDASLYSFLCENAAILPSITITSGVTVKNEDGGTLKGELVGVDVIKASGAKCERCWSFSDSVGKNEEHSTLCERCAKVIG
ncbi:MAG: isoleucine--tRNA ligase [Ruminococcaceae bacterium]|nr:isoleucine--tRNA ligase [Oscillospiraceae bacterium]